MYSVDDYNRTTDIIHRKYVGKSGMLNGKLHEIGKEYFNFMTTKCKHDKSEYGKNYFDKIRKTHDYQNDLYKKYLQELECHSTQDNFISCDYLHTISGQYFNFMTMEYEYRGSEDREKYFKKITKICESQNNLYKKYLKELCSHLTYDDFMPYVEEYNNILIIEKEKKMNNKKIREETQTNKKTSAKQRAKQRREQTKRKMVKKIQKEKKVATVKIIDKVTEVLEEKRCDKYEKIWHITKEIEKLERKNKTLGLENVILRSQLLLRLSEENKCSGIVGNAVNATIEQNDIVKESDKDMREKLVLKQQHENDNAKIQRENDMLKEKLFLRVSIQSQLNRSSDMFSRDIGYLFIKNMFYI